MPADRLPIIYDLLMSKTRKIRKYKTNQFDIEM